MDVQVLPLRIQVCPKKGISPNQSYDLGMGFRPSFLLDRDGSGCLGYVSFMEGNGQQELRETG